MILTNLFCALTVFMYKMRSDLQTRYENVSIRRVLLDRKRIASETPGIIYTAVVRSFSRSVVFLISAYLLRRRESWMRNTGFLLSFVSSGYLSLLPRYHGSWTFVFNIFANLLHLSTRFYHFIPRIILAPAL